MAVQNYTPIDDLVAKLQKTFYTPLPSKEMEPLIPHEEQKNINIIVEHKEIDEEIRPHVQVHEETVEVPPDLKQMGVQATPTTHFPTQEVHTPISDAEIIEGLHEPVTSSFRWLAELALYILKHAHIILKTVHGKITRVVKN